MGLLNGIREAASRNFSANGVPDLFLVDVFRALPDAQIHLIAFVVFNRVDVAFDVFHGSTDGFPCRARLRVVGADLRRIDLFRDLAGLLIFGILGQRRGHRERNKGQCTDQDWENLFFRLLYSEPPCSVRVNFNPEPLRKVCAVVQCGTDQENSADYKSRWAKALEMPRKQNKNGITLSKYDRICGCENR